MNHCCIKFCQNLLWSQLRPTCKRAHGLRFTFSAQTSIASDLLARQSASAFSSWRRRRCFGGTSDQTQRKTATRFETHSNCPSRLKDVRTNVSFTSRVGITNPDETSYLCCLLCSPKCVEWIQFRPNRGMVREQSFTNFRTAALTAFLYAANSFTHKKRAYFICLRAASDKRERYISARFVHKDRADRVDNEGS